MLRRITAIASLVALMSMTSVPPANAQAATAVCAVGITFSINPPYIGSDLSAPDFTFEGSGTCATTLGGEVVATTEIWGDGSSLLWNCAAVVAGGEWHQRFSNLLPNVDAEFNLTGENGAWTVAIAEQPWVAAGALTTIDAVKVGTCAVVDIGTITMTGVLVLQDP